MSYLSAVVIGLVLLIAAIVVAITDTSLFGWLLSLFMALLGVLLLKVGGDGLD